jgi:type VI protein secretion system component Hcp
MRNPIRIVFMLLALAAANTVLAQQVIVFSVEGWNLGKGAANSFQWAVTAPAPAAMGSGGGGAGKVSVQDSVLLIPIGDAAVHFAQTAMRGEHLRSVLVEFPLTRGPQGGPAPFAIRLTDVLVTSVGLSKSGDSGPGAAEIKLNAARVELFSSRQDSKGQAAASSKAGFDTKANKPF